MMRTLAGIALCLVFSLHEGTAQVRATTGDLRVVVLDESAAPISGVRVALLQADTGLERNAVTEQHGRATLSALAVGRYAVRAELDPFRPIILDDVTIEIGTTRELRVTMRLAARAETVDVIAPGPLLDTHRTVVSTVLSDQHFAKLPIDRRNHISFAVLAPGVATDRTPNQGPAETSGLSFAGQSARANNITVDGLDNNDDATGGVRAVFSQDAVREFQVLVHSYSAEFGKAAGGVVNIVTKSGTNRVTADVFGFYRDRALTSRGYFDDVSPSGVGTRRPKPPFVQRQFGATLGGPLRRSRTFAFGAFERLAMDHSAAVTIDDRTVVPHPVLGVAMGTAPEILNAAGFPVETGNVPFEVSTTTGLVKLDHVLTEATNAALRFNMADGHNGNSQPFGGLVARSRGGALQNRDYAFAGALTSVRTRIVNELRLQIARRNQEVRSLDPACGGPCATPEQGGPALEIVGVARVGRHNFTPQHRNTVRYQMVDVVSLERGRHLFKAGADLNVVDNRSFTLPLNFGGQFFFAPFSAANAASLGITGPVSAMQAFALGYPSAYVQGYGNPYAQNRFFDVAVFVQDEWRPTDTLTLRLGLRYQKQFWGENYESGNFDAGPRTAVSWDPAGNGRTSIAAAYGLFFDGQFNAPVGSAQVADGDGNRTVAFQGALAAQAWRTPGRRLPQSVLTSAPSLTLAVPRSFDVPYTHQYSVTLNHQLASDIAVNISFVATQGNRFVGVIDYNPLVSSLGVGRRPADANGIAGTSASILQYTPWGQSWYRGLLASATKRVTRGFQGIASYTLSRAEDTISDFIASPPQHHGFGRDPDNAGGLPVGFDRTAERGPSLQDQRHRFVATAVHALPLGFEVSGIFTAASGRPFNIIAGLDLNADGDATVSPGPDRPRRVPSDQSTSIGRNAGRLPPERRLDARVTKRLDAGTRTTVTLTIDLLNVLNLTNFTEVNRVFGPGAYPSQPLATFGQFTQAGPPRQLQIGARISY